ncbi:hypothetical protein M1N56_06245 [Dehalococcoidia bacterium]|nr:hypothetical protein [Dehalococcoidia bacterium]
MVSLGGIFGESQEERQWSVEVNEKGWTDDKGNPDSLKKWASNHRSEIVGADGQLFAWRNNWFNPLLYPDQPQENDLRRKVLPIILSCSHEKRTVELQKALGERLDINPVPLRTAIIDYWIGNGILVESGGDNLRAGPRFLQVMGSIEDIISKAQSPVTEAVVRETLDDPSVVIPQGEGRVIMHGVILDVDALGLNEKWIYTLVDRNSTVISLSDLSDIPPLNLSDLEGVTLEEDQILEIVRSLCNILSARYPAANITVTNEMMTVGSPEQVAEAFTEVLKKAASDQEDLIEMRTKDFNEANEDLVKLDNELTKQRINKTYSEAEEKKLAIQGFILKLMEAKIINK